MCVITAAMVGGSVAAAVSANAAIAGTAISIVGAGLTIAGNEEQADAAKKQARYQQQIAEYEAELEQQRGNVELIRWGINARREFGRQVVLRSAYGADLSFGDPAQQFSEMRQFQAFDSNLIARTTEARVLGIRLRGEEARLEAKNVRTAATFANIGAGFQLAADLGSNISTMYETGTLGLLVDSPSSRKAVKYGNEINPGRNARLASRLAARD